MKPHWENLISKVDAISLRERGLIFAAAAFALVVLIKALLFDPLLVAQKKLSAEVQQKQEKMKETQAQIDASSQARKNIGNSPLRQRIELAKQQLADGEVNQQSLRARLVEPEKMAALLEQVLNQNGRLQLVDLQTLPVAPLDEKAGAKSGVTVTPSASAVAASVKPGGAATAPASAVTASDKPGGAGAASASVATVPENQVFKHEVKITIRGSYLDLLQYLTELEQLPTQMFWSEAEMKVNQYPEVELKLTICTLSLDKTWLKI